MPSCRPDVIPGVLYKLMDICPGTILDVGAGYGKWGILCSEYLRFWKDRIPTVDGVEVFKSYRSPAHDVYREVYYTDIMAMIDKVPEYDLVLAIDVIEHLEYLDGKKLLDAATGYIVSTPGYWSAQGSCFGNDHEAHISKWKPQDFANSELFTDKLGRHHILGWKG